MKKATDPSRNRPEEKGRNNDPDLRDESAVPPGTNTISNSDYDDANQQITETAADDFRTTDQPDPNADRTYNEVDKD